MHPRTIPPSGFTIIELSLVLVITGLLLGGVLVGKDMIHQAKIFRTVNQIREINTGVLVFWYKYSGYPGDLMNATSYFGTTAGTNLNASCASGLVDANGICNGNGNAIIEYVGTGGNCTTYPNATGLYDPDCQDFTGERQQFFMQLGLAGLTQQYDGSLQLGVGYPTTPLGGGMMVANTWKVPSASNMHMENYTKDSFYLYIGICNPNQFGVVDPNSWSLFNDCGVFTPEEARALDSKLDDGLPLSGKMLGQSFNTICAKGTAGRNNSNPATPANGLVNAYDLSSKYRGCNLLFSFIH